MMTRDLLVVITARGGSKGIPGKNTKSLGGRPLLCYTIDNARAVAEDIDICLTTDSENITAVAASYGLETPFVRPNYLAADTSSTYEVLLHAVDHYENMGVRYNDILLLQPTSPFRTDKQVVEALALYQQTRPELLVSVKETSANPYYNLFEENKSGYLEKSKHSNINRRQDLPKVYELNGAIYLTSIDALRDKSFSEMKQVVKYVMDERSSHDLDTSLDWMLAEILVKTI